jgi:hypothetical protein
MSLKVSFYCKLKLLNEDFLETEEIVLFIKKQHGFFISIPLGFVAHEDTDSGS